MTDSRKRRPARARVALARSVKPKPAKKRPAKTRAQAAKAGVTARVTAKPGTRVSAKARPPRISVGGKTAFPLPKSSFRIFIGSEEVYVASVSPLHLADTDFTDPDLRQTVILRRAVGNSRTFYDWNLACRAGKDDIRTVTIALLDSPGGKPAGIWQLTGAKAVRWTGPDMDAMAHEIAMEELELIYESIAWRSRT